MAAEKGKNLPDLQEAEAFFNPNRRKRRDNFSFKEPYGELVTGHCTYNHKYRPHFASQNPFIQLFVAVLKVVKV